MAPAQSQPLSEGLGSPGLSSQRGLEVGLWVGSSVSNRQALAQRRQTWSPKPGRSA